MSSGLFGTRWIARSGHDIGNACASLVENEKIIAALGWHLSSRDGEQLAFDFVIDHTEAEGFAGAIGLATGLASAGGVDAGRLGEGILSSSAAGDATAGATNLERQGGGGGKAHEAACEDDGAGERMHGCGGS